MIGGAEFSAAEAFGEFGGGSHLLAGDAAAENGGTDIAEARLALGVNADVVADRYRRGLCSGTRGIEVEAEARCSS